MAIITLTSDIGHTDYLPGAIKGKLLTILKNPVLADITHELEPFNMLQAAYMCRNAFWNYPQNTYHIVIANLFDLQSTTMMIAKDNGQYIFCADNGLVEMILKRPPEIAVKLSPLKPENNKVLSVTTAFAKAIQQLENGLNMEEIGQIKTDFIAYNLFKPVIGNNWIERPIIFIDKFENVIVDITEAEFEKQRGGRDFQIIFRRNEFIDKISNSYADVNLGDKAAIFNSAGYLEIAINKGNAAGLFGLKSFSEFQQHSIIPTMMYQTIKINFINEK